jgi:hypothetical protein
MFRKRDLEFQESLDDPAKLEKRMGKLAKLRLMFTAVAAFATTAFFVIFIMEIQVFKMNGKSFPGTVLLLAISIQPTIMAMLAHCEIRTLITFKKLRDLSDKW